MPNYVYNTIQLTKELTSKQKKILKKIEKQGICNYYLPMPESLNITSGSAVDGARRILKNEFGVIPENKGNLSDKNFEEAIQSFKNEKLYGAKDWYEWKNKKYGTKWGDFDIEIRDNIITYTTAWSPLSFNVIEKLQQDFPNFEYEWEEEQGFGELYLSNNSILTLIETWNIPDIVETSLKGKTIYKLKTPYKNLLKGYYSEFSPTEESFLGTSLKEIKNNLL